MKRIIALVAAVVMVCVAIVIRSNIDSGGSGTKSSSGPITIACVTELAAQCKALSGVTVRVEDAGTTAIAIAERTANIDGWVTFDPWPEIVNEFARAIVTGDTKRIVASPLVIALAGERAAAFAPTCAGGSITWKCLGEAIGKPWTAVGGKAEWGTVKAGIPPVQSGLGLILLGNAASGYFGSAGFASNDLEGDFLIWRANLTATPASFSEFILKFPAAFSAVGATAGEVNAGKGSREVISITPNPPAFAVVVLAQVDNRRALDLAGDLSGPLERAGWGPLPADQSGLPAAGVLLALSGLK